MVNPFEETQQAGIINPNEVDALAKQQYDLNRANTEFSRFHAKSDPTAQMYEQAAYEQHGNPEFFNARSPRVFENTQWSPNYPGPKFDTRFIVGSSKSSRGLKSLNRGEYYDRMKGQERNWMDVLKEDVRHRLGISNEPGMEAGITNPNLGGAKVWNASGPTDWLNYLKRYLPGYDPEQDVRRHEQYQEQNPDLDEQTQEDIDKGKEKARADWFAEYGPRGTGEYYPDKILRDAFPESYPYLGGLPTGEAITPDVMEEPTKPDIGPYTLEANLSQTWQDIVDRTGNEDLANEWLASQQAVNVSHDMGDDVEKDGYNNPYYEEEEDGGGWLSNPLLEQLRKRNMERSREMWKKRMMDDRNRMMEDSLKFQMDMLMNPNKFNTAPGTGDINPIFSDPYWNI
jgi:hypothetical protein